MSDINISPEAVEQLAHHDDIGGDALRFAPTLRALSTALTQSRAETAAAYERAAETAEDYVAMRINQIETEKSKAAINIDVPQVMRWGAGKVQAEVIRDAIRALATPDQTAALDKLIAEAEARIIDSVSSYIKLTYGDRWSFLDNPIDRQRILAASKKGGV